MAAVKFDFMAAFYFSVILFVPLQIRKNVNFSGYFSKKILEKIKKQIIVLENGLCIQGLFHTKEENNITIKRRDKMSQVLYLNDENFDAETAEGVVLVDFWAEWCGPCKMLSPILDQIAEEIGDKAKVVKVNAEESMNLAKRFAVRSIPALYVMKDGEIVKNLPGVQDKAALIKALEL